MVEKKNSGDYKVGYGKPPRESKFKKGQSGNPMGRPKKAEPDPVDVVQILNESITVRQGGVTREISPFEAAVRKLVSRALKDENFNAALTFFRLCEKYGIVKPEPSTQVGGILSVPKAWDWDEWMEMFMKYGAPPWPGSRSGLPDSGRLGSTEGGR